jgi:hypothetical protein
MFHSLKTSLFREIIYYYYIPKTLADVIYSPHNEAVAKHSVREIIVLRRLNSESNSDLSCLAIILRQANGSVVLAGWRSASFIYLAQASH